MGTGTIDAPATPLADPQPSGRPSAGAEIAAAAPMAVAVFLLFLASWYDGAFAVRSWGPLALVVLAVVALLPYGRPSRPALVFAAAFAGLAAWTLASALWSSSPGTALEGGARASLYAALIALPVLTLRSRGGAVWMGRILSAGAGVMVALTLAATRERRHGALPRRAPQRPDGLPQRDGGPVRAVLLAAARRRGAAPPAPARQGDRLRACGGRAGLRLPDPVARGSDRLRLRRRGGARPRPGPAAPRVADDRRRELRGRRLRTPARAVRRLPRLQDHRPGRGRLGAVHAPLGRARGLPRRAAGRAARRRPADRRAERARVPGDRGGDAGAGHGRRGGGRPRGGRQPGLARRAQGRRVQAGRGLRARRVPARIDGRPALRPLADRVARVRGAPADRRRRGLLPGPVLPRAVDRSQPEHPPQPAAAGPRRPGAGGHRPAGRRARRGRRRAGARLRHGDAGRAPVGERARRRRRRRARAVDGRLAVADPRADRAGARVAGHRRGDRLAPAARRSAPAARAGGPRPSASPSSRPP